MVVVVVMVVATKRSLQRPTLRTMNTRGPTRRHKRKSFLLAIVFKQPTMSASRRGGGRHSDVFVPFLHAIYKQDYPNYDVEAVRGYIGAEDWDRWVASVRASNVISGTQWNDLNPDATGYVQAPLQEWALGIPPASLIRRGRGIGALRNVDVTQNDAVADIGTQLKQRVEQLKAQGLGPPRRRMPGAGGETGTGNKNTGGGTGGNDDDDDDDDTGGDDDENTSGDDEGEVEGEREDDGQRRGRGRPRGSRTDVTSANAIQPGRTIAVAELEPFSADLPPPDVYVWPLDGPGAKDFIVLHAIDTYRPEEQRPRDNVVIVDVRAWPPTIHVYDYRLRPLQPRWVTADGQWLARRTLKVVNAPEQGKYRRKYKRWRQRADVEGGGVVQGDRVQTARAVVPMQQEYVELYESLDAMLGGSQPVRSLLFPQETTHDLPDYMAVVTEDGGIVAMSSVMQLRRGRSHPWYASADSDEFQPLTDALPLNRDEERQAQAMDNDDEREAMHRARPVTERPSESAYVVGVAHEPEGRAVLVWNGRGYVHDALTGRWSQRYDFQSTDLGMRVPYWSSVINESGDIYYVNNMTLRKTIPLSAARVGAVDAEDRYAAGNALPSRLRRSVYEEPFDGYSASGAVSSCTVDQYADVEQGRERTEQEDGDDAIGRDGRLRLNDLHGVSVGPDEDVLVLRRKPYNTRTLAYVYDARTGAVLPLLRRRHFGINMKTIDVPMVRYFANMRMRTRLRHRGRGRSRRQQESNLRDVRGGFIALAHNKLVYVDALNAGIAQNMYH